MTYGHPGDPQDAEAKSSGAKRKTSQRLLLQNPRLPPPGALSVSAGAARGFLELLEAGQLSRLHPTLSVSAGGKQYFS